MRIKTLLKALAVSLVLFPMWSAAEDFNYTYFDVTYLENGMEDTLTTMDGRDRVDLNIGDGDGIGVRASLALNPNVHMFAGYAESNMDVNATHTVPFPTLDAMRDAFFTVPGAENWDGLCDLNADGVINPIDLGLLRAAQGDTRVADYAAVEGDTHHWRLGVGYNRLLTPRIGGYAQMFWETRDLDLGTARFMGETRDFGVSDDGFGATLGARARVNERIELDGHLTYSPVGDVDLLAADAGDRLRHDTLFGLGAEVWVTETLSFRAEVEGNGDVARWNLGTRLNFGGGS